MAILNSTDAIYETFGKVLGRLADAEGFESRLRAINQTIQFVLTDPDAVVTAEFRKDRPLRVIYGDADATPDIVLRMESAAAVDFLLGSLNVFLALDTGEIAMQGERKPVLAAIPQMRTVVPAWLSAILDEFEHGPRHNDGPLPESLTLDRGSHLDDHPS